MKHQSSPAGHTREGVAPQPGVIWFVAKYRGKQRRCGIELEALALLETACASGLEYDPPAQRRILTRHLTWIRALAVIELEEQAPSDTPLVLTAAQVRFQLACDASPALPDVLCF
jgi:hypothetical protein